MDSIAFDKFLSENCVKPTYVYVHPYLLKIREFRRAMRFANYLKYKRKLINVRSRYG